MSEGASFMSWTLFGAAVELNLFLRSLASERLVREQNTDENPNQETKKIIRASNLRPPDRKNSADHDVQVVQATDLEHRPESKTGTGPNKKPEHKIRF